MADTAVDFFLETLKQLMSSKLDLIIREKDQFQSLAEDLQSLRTYLKDSEEKRYEHMEVKKLVTQIRDVASEAENVVELFVVAAFRHKESRTAAGKSHHPAPASDLSLKLGSVRKEIKTLVNKVKKIYDEKKYGFGVQNVKKSSGGEGSSRSGNAAKVDEETAVVVGFDDQMTKIIDRLDGGEDRLEIISIIGTPGVGKTTLARKVYDNPFTVYLFKPRAWITVSMEYQKRDLLIGILESADLIKHGDYELNDDKLAEEVSKRLRTKKYLIVMDDIWSVQAWIDIKRSFPNESTGSKVIFTSRHAEVAELAQPDSSLRFTFQLLPLPGDKSWELLQNKLFGKEICPPELVETGKEIAEKCGGLPLAIVVIAGILDKEEKTREWWKQVAKRLSSIIARNQEVYLDTLALSYNHLPLHLKACFVYLGAFPEDYEIPVRKLIWLWIAEGFIQHNGEKSLEATGEDCLRDLVHRSLVMVARKRSNGGIKACRIHDLLRDLCLRKAEEDNFLRHIYEHDPISYQTSSFTSSSSIIVANKHRRLFINRHIFQEISLKHYASHLRSLLCFGSEKMPYTMFRGNTIFLNQGFLLLRVLDLISISIRCFPEELETLIHLRYLALWAVIRRLPPSISNLLNLETLVLGTVGTANLPHDIFKMVNLRHLYTTNGEFHVEILSSRQAARISCPPSSTLDNLQTMDRLCPCLLCQKFLAKTPNLKKLGLSGNLISESGDLIFPDLEFLTNLETLKCINRSLYPRRSIDLVNIKFPETLKKLNLQNTALQWEEMSILEEGLPNLEVLKLLDEACVGSIWNTNEGAFPRLKYLRFRRLDIAEWTVSDYPFPSLEVLVLEECLKLEAIPAGFADVPELQTVEVKWCSRSMRDSAEMIKEEQVQNRGVDCVNLVIRPYDDEGDSGEV